MARQEFPIGAATNEGTTSLRWSNIGLEVDAELTASSVAETLDYLNIAVTSNALFLSIVGSNKNLSGEWEISPRGSNRSGRNP